MPIEFQGPESGSISFFEPLLKSAQSMFGRAFTPEAQKRLFQAVQKRLEALSLDSLSEYAAFLRRETDEWGRLWPLADPSSGAFLRPAAQFEVAGELLSEWSITAPERSLRVLSLGCGPGFEVVSLAIMLEETGLRSKNWKVDIYGLDLNPEAIGLAETGVFSSADLDWLTENQRKKWFSPRAGGFYFKSSLAAPIHLAAGNVYEPESWPFQDLSGQFDLIFCRELTFDASPSAVGRLTHILRHCLAPTGFIFTAPGEFLPSTGELHLEERSGVTYYRRGQNKVKVNRHRSKKEKSGRDSRPAELLSNELSPFSPREKQLFNSAQQQLAEGRPEAARLLVSELMLSALDGNRPAPEAWRLVARIEAALGRPESAKAAEEAAEGY